VHQWRRFEETNIAPADNCISFRLIAVDRGALGIDMWKWSDITTCSVPCLALSGCLFSSRYSSINVGGETSIQKIHYEKHLKAYLKPPTASLTQFAHRSILQDSSKVSGGINLIRISITSIFPRVGLALRNNIGATTLFTSLAVLLATNKLAL